MNQRWWCLWCVVLAGCPKPETPDASVPVVDAAVPLRSECSVDADCGEGRICMAVPGCDAEAHFRCAPSGWVAPGPYCGCDGRVFTRNADGTGEPFRPWQGLEACGLDAGEPPPSWREYSWAGHYDDAGVRLAPRVAALDLGLTLGGATLGRPACAGGKVVLTPPAGVSLPARAPNHRAFVGCGQQLIIDSWTSTRVTLTTPSEAPGECIWLGEATDEEVALLEAACAGRVTEFSDGGFAAPDRCQRRDGVALNSLRRAPVLNVTAFAGEGPPIKTATGRAVIFSKQRVRFSWETNADRVERVFRNAKKQVSRSGEEWLEGEGEATWTATNECGTTTRKISQSAKASFSLSGGVELADGEGDLEVWLDEAPKTPVTLSIDRSKLPKGVVVPDTIKVEANAKSVRVPVKSARGPSAPLGALRISGPGFSRSEFLELRAVVPPRGFADLHVHMFSNEAFGKTGFYGDPAGSVDDSLRECSETHGANGWLDALNLATKMQALPAKYWTVRHDTHGSSTFGGWPDALDYTHQQVHYTALKRAWQGGMRLMVMLAVNNEFACGFAPRKNRVPCDDRGAMFRQLEAVKRFAASREALQDGSSEPWFVIVRDAESARNAIRHGQLAVVLGIELDEVLPCESCTAADVAALADELHDAGVRHVFPVHFKTNHFGGSALINILISGTRGPCPGEYGGKCNTQGLTDLGHQFLTELMRRKMIIDIDHQSLLTRTATLQQAVDAGYPVVSGHAWMWSLMKDSARTEGTLTPWQERTVYELGGLVGVLTNHSDHLDEMGDSLDARGQARVPQMCGKSIETLAQAVLEASKSDAGFHAVGFGSDFNGFAGQPSGRGTGNSKDDSRACVGGRVRGWSPKPTSLVKYPFQEGDESFDRSAFGGRLYDLNTDGFAHIGMYPDVLEGLRKLGLTEADLDPVMYSADGYVRMWEQIDAR